MHVETCVNGLMDTVSWVLNYSGQDFILFYFIFWGLWYLVDGYRLMHDGFENILLCLC